MSQFKEHAKLISSLSTFVLNDANLERFKEKEKHVRPVRSEKKVNPKRNIETEGRYAPTGTPDSLFWCFYIIKNSISHYEMNQNHLFQLEKQLKFEILEDIRKHLSILKSHKLKHHDVENNLCNDQKISFSALQALCLLYQLNIIVLQDRMYFAFTGNEESNIIHVVHKNGQKHSIELETAPSDIEKYRKDLFLIDNPSKPMRAISAYKLEILKEISIKLSIALPNRVTKKMIYDEITAYIEGHLY